MQSRLLQDGELTTYAVVLDTGDDVLPSLLRASPKSAASTAAD